MNRSWILSMFLSPLPALAQAPPVDPSIQRDLAAAVERLRSEDIGEALDARREILDTGRAAVPLLVRKLESDDVEGRHLACDLLAELRDPAAAPALVKLLKGREKFAVSLASRAARALAGLGDPAAIPPLREALAGAGDDTDLRYEAARALGLLRARDAVPDLLKLVDDTALTAEPRQRYVDCAAVEALGLLRARGAVAALMTSREPPVPEKTADAKRTEPWTGKTVQAYALRAMTRIVDPKDIPADFPAKGTPEEQAKAWKAWWDATGKIKYPAEAAEVAPVVPSK